MHLLICFFLIQASFAYDKSCKTRWERCMDDDRIKPTSSECDEYVKKYDCPSSAAVSKRAREDEEQRNEPPRNRKEPERPRYEEEEQPKPKPRRRNYGDDELTEINAKKSEVADNMRHRYEKASNNREEPADEIRKRDKLRKEKQQIFVKEDLVELDENPDDDKNRRRAKKPKIYEENISSSSKKSSGSSGSSGGGGLPKVLGLGEGLL